MIRNTVVRIALTLALVGGGYFLWAQPAQAASSTDTRMFAMYGGQRIDLAGDWKGAHVCSVWRAQQSVECFSNQRLADQRTAELNRTVSAQQALATCSTPLRISDDVNNRGRTLQYFDRGSWQNIPLDFNDKTSSYSTGSCTSHLAENSGGRGYWYPGNTSPFHVETWMGSAWNDRVSSVKND